MSTHEISRRSLLRAAALGVAAAAAGRTGVLAEAPKALRETPNVTLGPFYPLSKPEDRDADLTVVRGRTGHAADEDPRRLAAPAAGGCRRRAGVTKRPWHSRRPGFNRLTKAEQICRLEALWDPIADQPGEPPAPAGHSALAEERLARHRKDPSRARPAPDVGDRPFVLERLRPPRWVASARRRTQGTGAR